MPEYDPQVDYYEVLQVHPRARLAVIRAAHRVILRELRAHPDLGGREDFAKLLNEAYRVLSDRGLRAEYDGARLLAATRTKDRGGAVQVVPCPHCGEATPLPLGTDLRRAQCSSCGAALHVEASAPKPESKEPRENVFRLGRDEYERLRRDSQLDCRPEQVSAAETLRCRFCGNDWVAKSAGRPLRICPTCDRGGWHTFRVLKCRVCGHEWRSSRLSGWAYRDHPRCPNCAAARWNSYCESHLLSWLAGLVRR